MHYRGKGKHPSAPPSPRHGLAQLLQLGSADVLCYSGAVVRKLMTERSSRIPSTAHHYLPVVNVRLEVVVLLEGATWPSEYG